MARRKSSLKNVTFSADEGLVERAREKARGQKRSLNDLFREWLEQFTHSKIDGLEYTELMKRLSHVDAGRKFSREELNER